MVEAEFTDEEPQTAQGVLAGRRRRKGRADKPYESLSQWGKRSEIDDALRDGTDPETGEPLSEPQKAALREARQKLVATPYIDGVYGQATEMGTNPYDEADTSENMLRMRATALMKKAVRFASELQEKQNPAGDSLMDDFILQARVSGMSVREISLQINSPMYTEEKVAERLTYYYNRTAELTSTEMRVLQTQRLELVLNAMFPFVTEGSTQHAEVWLKTMERMNKLLDLESNRTKVEIEIISSQQALLFLAVMDAAVRVLLSDQRISNVLAESEAQAIMASAMDAAQDQLGRGLDQRVVVDG